MRGRKPKPLSLRLIEGNPGKRPLPADAPKPRGKAQCPAWLPEPARQEWARLGPELERLGLLTAADQAVFAGYCLAMARVRADAEKGDVSHYALRSLASLAAEFGLTPSSRTRLHAGGAKEEDPFEAYLGKRG
jgi:phage terminase small subunit